MGQYYGPKSNRVIFPLRSDDIPSGEGCGGIGYCPCLYAVPTIPAETFLAHNVLRGCIHLRAKEPSGTRRNVFICNCVRYVLLRDQFWHSPSLVSKVQR